MLLVKLGSILAVTCVVPVRVHYLFRESLVCINLLQRLMVILACFCTVF